VVRIFRPLFILLASVLICANLVAARPLALAPANSGVSFGPPLGDLFALSTAPAAAPANAPVVARPAVSPRPAPVTRENIEAEIRATRLKALRAASKLAPQPAPAAIPAPARIAGDGPHMPGTLVAQTNRLDLYFGKNTFSADQVAELAPLLEWLLRKNEARFGTWLDHRVSIAFYRTALAPSEGVRGMAFTDSGRVEIYYRPYEDTARAATIVAHELGHHLEAQRYGEAAQRRADTILHEGMATWIAGHRWLDMCNAPTWRDRARQLRDAGVPLRLLSAESHGADNAYELWASFVHFLTLRYGWEKLDALYLSGRGRAPGSANYQEVLGKSLDDLADEWREWVGD
jgi:hypothetical protein